MKRRLNYEEGTCFFVPLRQGGFGRGVVARLNGRGIVFAYFFGPTLREPNSSFEDVEESRAQLVGLCGDLGLLNGEWPIDGKIEEWNRNEWPLPPLYREDAEARRAWLSYYDEETLKVIREDSIEFGQPEVSQYPNDGLMGYGAAEITLTKLLRGG